MSFGGDCFVVSVLGSGGASGTRLLWGALPHSGGVSGAAAPGLLMVPGMPHSGHCQSEAPTNFAALRPSDGQPQGPGEV